MRAKLIPASLIGLCLTLLLFGALTPCELRAADGPSKIEAQLIWGTNDSKSPDPNHKPVDPAVKKKLQELPLKWTNYFEVNRKSFEVPVNGSKRVGLSRECEIEVKNVGRGMVEVTHFGKGQQVWKGTQALPKGETLVLGGNAPNATSWLVVLKRTE